VFPSRRKFKFDYTALTEADVETLYNIYTRVGLTTPIALWLDAEGTDYDKDRFFLYGRFSKNFSASNNFFTFFDEGIELEEAF